MSSEPKFVPKPGQVDFTHVRWCPVINCVLVCNEQILLVQRSASMRLYPGYWNGISGFIDDHKSLEEKVYEELAEEVGYTKDDIVNIKLCGVMDQEATDIGKTWIVHAVRVEVAHQNVALDWEAQQHVWITPEQVSSYNLLPGFQTVIDLTTGTPNQVVSV